MLWKKLESLEPVVGFQSLCDLLIYILYQWLLSVVPRWRNLLELRIIRPYPRPVESETQEVVPNNLFSQAS